MQTEGWTDITKLVAGFCFENAPKNENKPTKPRRLNLSSGTATEAPIHNRNRIIGNRLSPHVCGVNALMCVGVGVGGLDGWGAKHSQCVYPKHKWPQ